jgi:hypothetical protein
MAEVGNLTVKVGIDGAAKAVQDLEKIRRQLELINTLARNVAASFATVNTQLRTFDQITKSMDGATRSGEKYNYTLRNTARIIGDISRGSNGKALLDLAQTASIVGSSSRSFSSVFGSVFGAKTGPGRTRGRFGLATANAVEQMMLQSQFNAMQNPFLNAAASSPQGQRYFPGLSGVSATGNTKAPFTGGMQMPGVMDYIAKASGNFANRGVFSGLNTPFGGAGSPSLLGLGVAAGVIGGFVVALKAAIGFMQFMATSTIKLAEAFSGLAISAVQITSQFQDLRSANLSTNIGNAGGFTQAQYATFASNPNAMFASSRYRNAKAQSNSEFDYIRMVAEKSPYSIQEIAGAANVLKTGGIPLNKFLETTAKTGSAVGLKGNELQLLARVFQRQAFGDYPDPEVAARFGLTRSNPALKNFGITFDKDKQLTSSTSKTVNGMRDYLESRFGAGFILTANNFSTKLASVMDKISQTMTIVGEPVLEALNRFFDAFTKSLERLSNSGVLDLIALNITNFIDSVVSYMNTPDFINAAAGFFAVVNEVPRQLKFMFEAVKEVVALITDPQELLSGNLFGNVAGIGADLFMNQLSAVDSIMWTMEYFKNSLRFAPMSGNKKKFGEGDDFTGPDLTKAQEDGNKKLQQLVDNSKKLVDLFDLRRQTIGLGPLSQIGVTGVELAAAGMPMSSSHKIDPSNYSSISAGPVRGINQLEKGINALNRENQNKAKAGRGIRTSR